MKSIDKLRRGSLTSQSEVCHRELSLAGHCSNQVRQSRAHDAVDSRPSSEALQESLPQSSTFYSSRGYSRSTGEGRAIKYLQKQYQARSKSHYLSVNEAKYLTCQIQDATDCQTLQHLFLSHQASLNTFHLSALACSCARLQQCSQPWRSTSPPAQAFFGQLLTRTGKLLPSLDARCIANILWATAKIQHPIDRELLGRLMHEVLLKGPSFRPQELANIAWALANLSRSCPTTAAAPTASHTLLPGESQLPSLTFSHADDTLAQRNESPPGYAATAPLEPPPSSFDLPFAVTSPSSPSTTPSQSWLHGFMLHATPQISSMIIQEQCTFLWSLATMNYQPPTTTLLLFEAATLPHLPSAHPQELTNLLWSFSHLSHIPSATWQASYFATAFQRLPFYNAQDLSITLYSCAKLHLIPPLHFLHSYTAVADSTIHTFTPQALSNMIWAAVQLEKLARTQPPSNVVVHSITTSSSNLHTPSTFAATPPHKSAHLPTAQHTHHQSHSRYPSQAPSHLHPTLPWDTIWVENLLHRVVLPLLPSFPPLSLSTLFSAISTLPQPLSPATSRTLHTALAPLLPRFTPSQFSHLLRALVSTPQPLPQALHTPLTTTTHTLLPSLTPRLIPIVLWSLTRLHVALPPSTLALFVSTTLPALPKMTPPDLTLLLWSLPHYQLPRNFIAAVAKEAEFQLPAFHASHLAVIWSRLQKLGVQPSSSLARSFFSECTAKAGWMAPRDAALIMWACAKMQLKVPGSCMEQLWAQTGGRTEVLGIRDSSGQSGESGEQSSSAVLVKAQGCGDLKGAGLVGVRGPQLHACSGQQGQSDGSFDWEDEMWGAHLERWRGLGQRAGEEEGGEVAVAVHGAGVVLQAEAGGAASAAGNGVKRGRGSGRGVLQPLVQRGVVQGSVKGRDLVAAVWAAGVMLLVPPSGWLDAILPMFQAQLDGFSTRDISSVMWALARLHVYPGADWLEAALQACTTSLASASPLHLTNLAWAMSRFGEVPSPIWQGRFFARIVSVQDSFTPVQKRTLNQALVKMGLEPPKLVDWGAM